MFKDQSSLGGVRSRQFSRLIAMHPSDELYGADRVVLEVLSALREADWPMPIELWLPIDLPYPKREMSIEAAKLGMTVRRLDLPVLRREYLTVAQFPTTVRRASSTLRAGIGRRDLVYATTTAMSLAAACAYARRATVVAHVHESWGRLERMLLGPLLHSATDLVAVSADVKSRLPRGLQERTRVIFNGFARLDDPSDDSLRTRPTGETCEFLFASRWSAWKGLSEFLAAWNQADREDAHLTILGGPPPSGASVDAHELVRTLRRPHTVEVVGEVSDVVPFIDRADVVVVPSTKPDPLPTIALEACAYGRALFASDCGGLKDIVEDARNGLRLPPGDVEAWTAAIRNVTPASAQKWGLEGRAVFASKFGSRRFRNEIVQVFRSVALT